MHGKKSMREDLTLQLIMMNCGFSILHLMRPSANLDLQAEPF